MKIILWIFRMERIFIIWNIQVIISLGKRLSENNGQKRISKEDTDMSMTGISNSYNNYVTQNTNDTTKKNVAKSNSRQVEFKEFNSEIKEPKLSTVAKNVLDEIRKTYGDMDIMVYEDGKDAKELLSRSTKEFTVMFSAEELEKMASGEKYKKQQINGIQGAVRMSEAINEKYGYERAFGKQNNDVAISKIAISFNEDGSTTMFAELEKMSKQQRDHIEAAREKRAEEKKSVEKKAAQKEQEPVKRTIVSASSMDELIAKINEVDWNKVKEESNIGSRFDFSA